MIDFNDAMVAYPWRAPLDFFHLQWFVDLIKDKQVCDAGCHVGDGMVQMAKHAKSVCGIDFNENLFQKAKSRGLDVSLGSYYDNLPKADVYYCWPSYEHDVRELINNGVSTLVFQSPHDWNTNKELWDVSPNGFMVEPKINQEKLKELGDSLGGTLEFHSYQFEEPFSESNKYPRKGWRQAFVLKVSSEVLAIREARWKTKYGHDKDPKIILIAGNHRTGTSALAGSLELAGGVICDRYLKPDKYNEKGYFENQTLQRLNMQAMNILFGHNWFVKNAPPKHPVKRHEFYLPVENIFEQISNLLKIYLEKSKGKFLIIKDPRISFLLPRYVHVCWRMGVKPRIIFSDRPDEEIVESLKKRNGLSEEDILQHIRATREAATDAQVDMFWMSTFSALEYKPERALSYIAERLDLPIRTDDKAMKNVKEFIDSKLRHNRTSNNVKVMATYFGPRRTRPSMIDETIEWMKDVVELEVTIDKGVFADTIIVNHDIAKLLPDGRKAHEYLDSLDGIPTRNGVIKTISRPWNKGVGGSFGSFNYAFEHFKQTGYEYWFFTEDNVIEIADGYFSQCIRQLEEDSTIAFVGVHRSLSIEMTARRHPIHAHGGCGCVHVSRLKLISDKYGSLPYLKEPMPGQMTNGKIDMGYKLADKAVKKWYHRFENEGEVAFTNVYIKEGLKVVDLEMDCPVVRHRGNAY
jgi:hypothetical protein